MKKLTFISLLLVLVPVLYAQGDKITGYWLTFEGESQIKIFRATNVKYYG